MSTCIERDCIKIHFARGYCQSHYVKYIRPRCKDDGCSKPQHIKNGYCHDHRKDKFCFLTDCDVGLYSRGYCKNHYCKYISHRKDLKPYIPASECAWHNCIKISSLVYCKEHIRMFREGKNPNQDNRLGENNVNWRGGVAEYPAHSFFKRQRLIRLEQAHYTCEIGGCLEPAVNVHHKDESKDNHDLDNLIALCRPCHIKEHKGAWGKPPTRYGKLTIKEISKRIGFADRVVYDSLTGKTKVHRKVIAETIFNA